MNNDSARKDDGSGSQPDGDWKLGQSISGLDRLDVNDRIGQAGVGHVEGHDDVAFHGRVRCRKSNPGLT